MRRLFFIIILLGGFSCANAQSSNTTRPSTDISVGGRFITDIGYLNSDYTKLNSGAKLSDIRLRTSMISGSWKFFINLSFNNNMVKAKNIYARYSLPDTKNSQSIIFGYIKEPSSMARNVGNYKYHFISKANSPEAFSTGRRIGILYKYIDNHYFTSQGIFSENKDNNQDTGSQGIDFSGRWLFKAIHHNNRILHIGTAFSFQNINTGTSKNGIKKTNLSIKPSFNTELISNVNFLNADIPYVSNVINYSIESLFMTSKFFVRGEYMWKVVKKDVSDNILNASLEANHFNGGYIETGIILLGGNYSYSKESSLMNGIISPKTIEIVARYNHTNLNDYSDFKYSSNMVSGGKLNSATIGVNYVVNRNVQFMLNYTYNHLDNTNFPDDHNINLLQSRAIIYF